MLSKCANPACDAELHYLYQGKIFRIDTESLAHASRRAKPVASFVSDPSPSSHCLGDLEIVADSGGAYRPEYFWLCADCSRDWTIAVRGESVIVMPITPRRALHAIAS